MKDNQGVTPEGVGLSPATQVEPVPVSPVPASIPNAASPSPWKACRNGDCSCGQIWSVPADHPVATVDGPEWGDTLWVPLQNEDGSLDVRREFHAYGSFPAETRKANILLMTAAPELLQATLALYALIATDARYEGSECADLAREAIAKATGVTP